MILNTLHRKLEWPRRTPKNTGWTTCSGMVSSSCSTSDIRLVPLVTNPVISHEWVKDWIVIKAKRTYPWSCVIQIFRKVFHLINLIINMDLIWKKYLINVRENRMAIKNEQSRETGNIGYTRHRTLDKMSNQEWTI